MRYARAAWWTLGGAAVLLALSSPPDADADPFPGVPGIGDIGGGIGPSNPIAPPGATAGGGGATGAPGIVATVPNLAPAAASIFLCPGVGAAGSAVGGGGGYCDFDFQPVQLTAATVGIMHMHCEWGGFVPILEMWNCWRVFPGQPDHPKLTDPDIVPDGWGVPWAIRGPSPNDQWPPPGLAPAPEVGPPPPPGPPPPVPPPQPLEEGPPQLAPPPP